MISLVDRCNSAVQRIDAGSTSRDAIKRPRVAASDGVCQIRKLCIVLCTPTPADGQATFRCTSAFYRMRPANDQGHRLYLE
jgi:hypothetical protein